MSDCWICKQKGEWKRDTKNKIIEEAKLLSKQHGQTMAIWKEGCIWKTDTAAATDGKPNREFISVN